MAKFIHISDTKGRDANVLFSGFSKKSKIKTPTPEFLILSERLKEAAKLKASGEYRDLDFDKLVDAL